VDWSRRGLTEWGFTGFVSFDQLPAVQVPSAPGVYVVVLPEGLQPTWRGESSAGWFKGKNPSVPVEVLQRAWVRDASVVYIGKAGGGRDGRRGLRKRLDEYRRHGGGEPVGHWGGRYIWQMSEASRLLVAWKCTPADDPENIESTLIEDFVGIYGHRPFANRKDGRHADRAPAE
jgi:hypothetical protein